MQTFLRWLIDLGLEPEMARLQLLQNQETSWSLLLQSYSNQRVWLDHLSFIFELFIKSNDELKQQNKDCTNQADSAANVKNDKNVLEKIPEEGQLDGGIDNDDDLVPLPMSRSISMPTTPAQKVST